MTARGIMHDELRRVSLRVPAGLRTFLCLLAICCTADTIAAEDADALPRVGTSCPGGYYKSGQ